MADEYISGVVSLLHFNGANGSKTFKDSATPFNWTALGDAVISTDQSKFGGSAYFKPAGNHYLSTPSTLDLNMRTLDFTVELWVYPLSMAQYNFPIAKVEASNHNNFRMGFEGNGALYVHCSGAGNAASTPANTIVVNQWQHMALTRMGTTARVFIDGALKGTWTDTADIYNDTPVLIGTDGSGWNGFTGYIDEVRITKGYCRYTEDFTPPTEAFDDPPEKILLIRAFTPNLGRTDSNLPQLTLPHPAPPMGFGNNLGRRDISFGGSGRIAGTVKEKGTPDQPLQRRVQLFDETRSLLVAQTWSNPTTGAYLFENIDPTLTYTIISYDHTGTYRAVIANGQKATT
jgi:hypothetical protein